MKFKLTCLLFSVIAFVSCERKLRAPDMNGNGSAGIIGRWNLVSSGGVTSTSTETDLFGTAIRVESKLTFTSSNPKGYYNITSAQMKAVNVGYDYTGALNVKFFEDNVLQNEVNNPIPPTPIGPSNETAAIKIVGTDSIAFTNTSPVAIQGAPGTFAAPTGCKYKLEGNKLTLLIKFASTSTTNTGGTVSVDKIAADATIVLQKQ